MTSQLTLTDNNNVIGVAKSRTVNLQKRLTKCEETVQPLTSENIRQRFDSETFAESNIPPIGSMMSSCGSDDDAKCLEKKLIALDYRIRFNKCMASTTTTMSTE
mmetsp:Transcript_1630/g.2231  ORF Transcript_1630/g.2231 Transcript_1630/m.2231 type:complete len:104 (+) Transcript_1630:57-368(+)